MVQGARPWPQVFGALSRCDPWALLANRPCSDRSDGPYARWDFSYRLNRAAWTPRALRSPPSRPTVLAPSCNRDRALDVGVDDVLHKTRFVAFDLASVTIGTLAFVEAPAIADSIESRMLSRLFENDLNRRAAARGFNLATRFDKSPASPRGRNVQESRVMVVPHPISHQRYLCELRRTRAEAHLPTLPETPRCHTETATCAPPP
jgi:hypothetical protein